METDVAGNVAFEMVKLHMRATLPEVADSSYFVDLFDFVINYGSGEGPLLKRLASYHSAFVNAKVRRIRYERFALAENWQKLCAQSGANSACVCAVAERIL